MLGAVAAAAWIAYACLVPVARFAAPKVVSVNPGDSLGIVARRLASAGVVRSARATMLYAELTGGGRSLKPGDYAFSGGERLADVLRHLVNGDFVVVTVAIPEGATLHQIAERLEEAGLVCQEQFEEAARRGPLPAALGLAPLGAEGYLFPATYRFSPHATTGRILTAMLGRFYSALPSPTEERLFELNLSAHELVTLASIIEKEAKVAGERPTIASVFYNRLRLGMPLQSDPTAQYNPDGEIEPAATAVHTASAYNTYSFSGTPAGTDCKPWNVVDNGGALPGAHGLFVFCGAQRRNSYFFAHAARARTSYRDRAQAERTRDRRESTRPAIHAATRPTSAVRPLPA